MIIVMRKYPNTATAGSPSNIATKKVIFQNWAPSINCISKINNTQVDDANDIDIVMSLYNLIECSDSYSKTSESFGQYYKEEPALDNKNNIADFPANKSNSISFRF